jgi:hypothetical protein
MVRVFCGRLEGFSGSWGSGIGFLIINGEPIPCENTATVRALEACFGDAIVPGHTISSVSFKGREIVYAVDSLGMLVDLVPIERWEGPEIPPEGLLAKSRKIHSALRALVRQRDVPFDQIRHFKGSEHEVREREKLWESKRGKIIEVNASTCKVSAICGKLCWQLAPGPFKDEVDRLFGSHVWIVCECKVELLKN